jgi:hypothetical protein
MPTAARPDAKLRALRAHGAVHPHPEAVTDPAFAGSAFFDPRDAVQVKYEMVRRVQADGQPVGRAAAACGFSRPTFYQARAALAAAGLAGLLPRRRGPRRGHKVRGEVLAFLARARAADPTVGARGLAARVRERFELAVHPRSIERALARPGEKHAPPPA